MMLIDVYICTDHVPAQCWYSSTRAWTWFGFDSPSSRGFSLLSLSLFTLTSFPVHLRFDVAHKWPQVRIGGIIIAIFEVLQYVYIWMTPTKLYDIMYRSGIILGKGCRGGPKHQTKVPPSRAKKLCPRDHVQCCSAPWQNCRSISLKSWF